MSKKILIFSLGPIFKDYVHGGSQKILRDIAKYLGLKGHKIKILCVKRDDNKEVFQLFKNVEVHPILRFKQHYPAAYFTSPHNLAEVIEIFKENTKDYDIFYIHDSQLNFPFLYETIPTVTSLRDYIYPETLIGAFNFDRDKIIVNSNYVKNCVQATLGKIRKNIEERITVIPNGIDLDLFKRVENEEIKKLIPLNENDLVILYPHRPEKSKGIYQSFELIKRLKNRGLKNIKLLVPEYIDLKVDSSLKEHYKELMKIAKEKDIMENIIFHKWIPHDLMPAYYSLGKIILTIGNFIEAFGSNTILEALACGTYPITVKVGAIRTTLPENILEKFDFGDLDAMEEKIIKILTNQENLNFSDLRGYLDKHLNYDKMLKQYENLITTTTKLKKLELREKTIAFDTNLFKLAPWCYISKYGIYNDYKYTYRKIDKFHNFICEHDVFSMKDARKYGLTKADLKKEIYEGTIIKNVN